MEPARNEIVVIFPTYFNLSLPYFIFIDYKITFIQSKAVKYLPTACPSCSGKLDVRRLRCEKCETEVEGMYPLPPLVSLSQDDQAFILQFIKASGSLKEMAGLLKVSYPTVRNRLDAIIEQLNQGAAPSKEKK
jgi:hypothetical protein